MMTRLAGLLIVAVTGCGTQEVSYTKDMAPIKIPDMAYQCVPCSQSLPAVNCVPSLCTRTAIGLCCVGQ